MSLGPKEMLARLKPLQAKLPAKAPASIPKNTYGLFTDAVSAVMGDLGNADQHGPTQKDIADVTTAQKAVETARLKVNNAVDAQTTDLKSLKADVEKLKRSYDLLQNALKDSKGKDEQALLSAAGNFAAVAQAADGVQGASKV